MAKHDLSSHSLRNPKGPIVTRGTESNLIATGHLVAVIAAFCRLVFLQLLLDQMDMAEACGSRTHHPPREGTDRRL